MSAPGVRSMQTPRLLKRCGFLVAVSGVVCIGYILFRMNPSGEWQRFFPKCLFFAVTGLHCPGCGAQRALHHLFNGRLLLALQSNAMVMIALPWLTWEAARASLKFLELPVPAWMVPRRRLSGRQAMSIAIAVTAFWILRNIPARPFIWLAPPPQSSLAHNSVSGMRQLAGTSRFVGPCPVTYESPSDLRADNTPLGT